MIKLPPKSDAFLLPVIGYPSNNYGVLTHTDGSGVMMKIDQLTSKSPLANNALYSAECSHHHYLNLYDIFQGIEDNSLPPNIMLNS